jgi:hypothetical protein
MASKAAPRGTPGPEPEVVPVGRSIAEIKEVSDAGPRATLVVDAQAARPDTGLDWSQPSRNLWKSSETGGQALEMR